MNSAASCTRKRWNLCSPNGETVRGEACAPAKIEIDGFRTVFNEVLFVDGEDTEPLIGYVILEQAQAAVDMLDRRLARVPYIDMK